MIGFDLSIASWRTRWLKDSQLSSLSKVGKFGTTNLYPRNTFRILIELHYNLVTLVTLKARMRNASSTTIIEIASIVLLTVILGTIAGNVVPTGLVIVSGYLAITLWRRNSFYNWLTGDPKIKVLLTSDLWADIIKRVEIDRAQAAHKTDAAINELDNFKTALSSLNVGILLTDENWNLLWWNRISGNLLDLQESNDINAYLFSLLRSPSLKQYATALEFSEPLVLRNFPNPHSSIEIFFGHIPASGFIGLVRDITHLQKLNEMRSDFIANVSHELKTPLTVINGYLETLIDNKLVDGVAKKAVEGASSQGLRMSSIIQDLISLSQLETSETQAVDSFNFLELVNQVLQQTESIKDNLSKPNTKLHVAADASWTLTGNRNEIYSLMSNLLSNCVRYCPDGAMISIHVEAAENASTVVVEDNGPGIAEKHLGRLTERFYRVDSSHASSTGGTGLGLSIAKHVMSRHDGILNLRSTVGSGTRAECIFPKDRMRLIT